MLWCSNNDDLRFIFLYSRYTVLVVFIVKLYVDDGHSLLTHVCMWLHMYVCIITFSFTNVWILTNSCIQMHELFKQSQIYISTGRKCYSLATICFRCLFKYTTDNLLDYYHFKLWYIAMFSLLIIRISISSRIRIASE